MSVFNLHFLGRFGNCMFQYAYARAYCENHGLELHTDPWVGERLFEIEHPRCTEELPRRDEFTLRPGEGDVSYRSYSQTQACVDLYSRADCRRWFTPRAEIARWVAHLEREPMLAHYRADDYAPLGYVVVSKYSFRHAARKFGYAAENLRFVEQSTALADPLFDGWADFAPDFFRLMNAEVLFRSNSSFSWWTAVLSRARVYAPIITGKKGGQEHVCEFVEGNWPRFADLDFVTDLHLK